MLLRNLILIYFIRLSITYGLNNSPLVDIPHLGSIFGSTASSAWTGKTIKQFQNVKYAESPSGPRRFKPPEQVKSWDGVRDGAQPGHACPSEWLLIPNAVIPTDPEDCLHMSIYSTDLQASRPVLVFIYGYYFDSGSANDFAPNYLLEKDIVLVVPQFRLGALGFFSTGEEDFPGNYGVRDIVLALKWIKQYISYFGGDPNQITLAGHSGGAAIVQLLTMTDYTPADLFHKVIFISGSFYAPWALAQNKIKHSNPLFIDFAHQCSRTDDSGNCFKNTSAFDITQTHFHKKIMRTSLQLYDYEYKLVSDRVIVAGPLHLAMNSFHIRRPYNYPTLAGVTKHAGTTILFDAWSIFHKLGDEIGPHSKEFVKRFLIDTMMTLLDIDENTMFFKSFIEREFFAPNKLSTGLIGDSWHSLIDFFSTVHAKSPVFQGARYAADYIPESTFLYTFDYVGEHTDFLNEMDLQYSPFNGGVTIKDDLQYLFPRSDGQLLNEEDIKIAQRMVEMWTSFVMQGIPTISGEVQPPAMSNFSGPYLRINEDMSIGDDFFDEYSVTAKDAEKGKSIQCYNCDSLYEPDCKDPFGNQSNIVPQNCDKHPYTYTQRCFKVVGNLNGANYIKRSCYNYKEINPCDNNHIFGDISECYLCSTDLCNSSVKLFSKVIFRLILGCAITRIIL